MIGIIECGKNRSEWLSEHGDFADWFPPFLQHAYAAEAFAVYKAHQGDIPKSADACDAWLLTGSPLSVYDNPPWQQELAEFLVAAVERRPVVGICYGHQLLHQVLGGKVEKAPHWGVGLHTYAIHDMPEWLPERVRKASKGGLRLIALHQDQVSVPAPESRVLAGNASCPIGITTIGRNVLTIQAHPEMTPELAKAIYTLHRRDIGEAIADRAALSLAVKADSQLAADWIVAFLRHRSA